MPRFIGALDASELIARLDEIVWKDGGGGVWAMSTEAETPDDFPTRTIIARALALYGEPGARVGQILFSKLIPGQAIASHFDIVGNCTRRLHIPLQTNDKALFITHWKRMNMKVGSVYLINPRERHGVVNDGDCDRVHLIFEVL